MKTNFETNYKKILALVDEIDPLAYAKSRNHISGAVTYLSPYVSRGVISTKIILQHLFEKGYKLYQIESFVKELCWRDYFQRVAQVKDLSFAIRQEQTDVRHHSIPLAVMNAQTGIESIDKNIELLYSSGYMHNHARMYTAFLTCNLAKSHWLLPSKWMYYHLLDGDHASNTCSWQWVAGVNSSKKYYANQDNINKYTGSDQKNTYIDLSYEELAIGDVPEALIENTIPEFATRLPEPSMKNWNENLPTFVYNYYNMDPAWHINEAGNRVLLLDPVFFKEHPINENCMTFLLKIAENIPEIQIFVGSFAELVHKYPSVTFHYKEHPLNAGYVGIEEERDWIAPQVSGYYPSFFSYWKKAEKFIK